MKAELKETRNGIETYVIDNGIISAEITNFGARIHRLYVPDRDGNKRDVVIGFDDVSEYRDKENPYFNAVIGRVVNRIGNAQFTLNGKQYKLYKNDNGNCLHGGKTGFDSRIWKCEKCSTENGAATLTLTYFSPDGEENFPNNLKISVTYTVKDTALSITYSAESDGDTPFNPTNHAYFNLDGDFESACDHVVFINSHKITESDENLIATGKILDIKNTDFDFSAPKAIGKNLPSDEPLIKIARGGYDFNYILEQNGKEAAYAYSEKSRIMMTVTTDRPCLQFYTGNFLDGSIHGKKDFWYQCAFCMETQSYPNACNISSFPSIILHAGEKFLSTTTFRFSIR